MENKWTKEAIQKEIEEMDGYLPVKKIEEILGMPPTTLQKVLKGERQLPKKWFKVLETYFVRSPKQQTEKKKIINDMVDFGMAAHKTDEKGEVKHIPLTSEEGFILQQIAADEAELKTVPDSGLGKKRRDFLNNRINKLKRELNGRTV